MRSTVGRGRLLTRRQTAQTLSTMIDEDLYQQAADELNSDKRRPHLWARACALASDDHDEARYLYTNLRVEELLAEQAEKAAATPATPDIAEADPTLALTPVSEEAIDRVNNPAAEELISDTDLPEFSDEAPASFTAPSGVDKPESKEDFLKLEPLEQAASDNETDEKDKDTATDIPLVSQSLMAGDKPDPDADLMADYVSDEAIGEDPLEDTYTDDGLIEEGFQAELENFKAEENADQLPSDLDLESTTRIDVDAPDIAPAVVDAMFNSTESADADADGEEQYQDQTAELTSAFLVEDLTQANMDVLEAHTTELDDMLEDAHYQPPSEAPDTDMDWLDDDAESTDSDADSAIEHEPVVYEEDPFTDELSRQADELDVDSADETTDFSQQAAEDLAEDAFFGESKGLPEAAVGAAAGAVAMATIGDDKHATDSDEHHEDSQLLTEQAPVQPLDLTQGRKGKLFRVFNRNGETQVVKEGVSWSALFFTLPVLIYRKLFGTALAYALLWIISITGLVLCALAWRDAGTAVTPFVQAGTIGFALLAFIGLIYLPFRHANTWRSDKLEDKGFELVAIAKAKNKDLALARTRRHAAELG